VPGTNDKTAPSAVAHGPRRLSAVTVDAYSAEIRVGKQYAGDRASKGAFRSLLEKWREETREAGEDPLGSKPTEELSKKKLDKVLIEGDPEAAGIVQGAIEEFAAELAKVTPRFLKLKAWRSVTRIVVGGGMRGSRIGELAIGRASVLLKAAGHEVTLRPIRLHPDQAALVGAVHLVPAWMLAGHDAILALDIGGSKVRAGVVELNRGKDGDLSKSAVGESELWCYADDEKKPGRNEAVERIVDMLKRLVRKAEKADLTLAPFVGVGCPGVIAPDGGIDRGGQNLPGNWESSRFNLPAAIREGLPVIGGHETTVLMHNDAVVQGLSELPFAQDVEHWGVMTIGTGLGNAAFTNNGKAET
jgi:predicted NBD/HSP70 family sugar kinase